MLARLHRLRPARLLAILAILVMAGVGQHMHGAVGTEAASVLASTADSPCDQGGKAAAAELHCGACHLVRATMPDAEALPQPAAIGIVLDLPGAATRSDLAVPDGLARPPRRARIA